MKFWSGLVIAAALLQLAPAFAQSPKDAPKNAPPALQKEFDGFIAKFRAGLKANDAAAVALMTRLPFMNDANIGDAAQFRDKIYKASFTAKNRACLQRGKAVYDRDGENNDNFFIFCGEQIFVFTNTPAGSFSPKSAPTIDDALLFTSPLGGEVAHESAPAEGSTRGSIKRKAPGSSPGAFYFVA